MHCGQQRCCWQGQHAGPLTLLDALAAPGLQGIAEAMKRKLDRGVDKADWEQRLEAAAAAAAAGGNEVSRCVLWAQESAR